MAGLTIGKVAKESGVGIETIRFYERRGLIEEPARRPSGYRDYPPRVIARLRFIQRAKELGFSLTEIGDLLSLRVDRHRTCSDVLQVARHKISEIDAKIAALTRMRNALLQLSLECHGDGPTGECPILEALDADTRVGAPASPPPGGKYRSNQGDQR